MIHWPLGQWGGVRAHYRAPVYSCAVKWSRKTKGKMTVYRLFTSRRQESFKIGLIASPSSWSWFKVLTSISWCPVCCRDMFPFPQLRSPLPSCQPCEKWCISQKQREVIFDLPRPLPPKVPDRTASKYSQPSGSNGWTCSCGCPGDSNRSN